MSKRRRDNGLIHGRKGLRHDAVTKTELITISQQNILGVSGIDEARRWAIYYMYLLYGSPGPGDFVHVIYHIMRRLGIPANSHGCVRKVMQDVYDANMRGEPWEARQNLHSRGINFLINDMDPSAQVVYRTMKKGHSVTQATYMLNVHRRKVG